MKTKYFLNKSVQVRIEHVLNAYYVPRIGLILRYTSDRSFYPRERRKKLSKTNERIPGSHNYHEESSKGDLRVTAVYFDWGSGKVSLRW